MREAPSSHPCRRPKMVVRLSKAEAVLPGRDIRRYTGDMIIQVEAKEDLLRMRRIG